MLLRQLGADITNQVVLIGGQAVNFWVDQYWNDELERISNEQPIVSGDIDFTGGDVSVLPLVAKRLKGTLRLGNLDTVPAGQSVVVYVDERGIQRELDFIEPYGLRERDVLDLAIPATFLVGQEAVVFRVMHPFHVLQSRVFNTLDLPGYRTPRRIAQLRASVVCARAFLQDRLGAGDEGVHTALRFSERIFHFCHDGAGLGAFTELAVDVFSAIPQDERYPEKFRQLRYPQMVSWLTSRRERATRSRSE